MKKPVKLQNDDERTYPSTWDPNMWDPNMWGFELMRQWTGVFFQIYDYDGKDGRKVHSWIMHLGFARLIKYRYAEKRGQVV